MEMRCPSLKSAQRPKSTKTTKNKPVIQNNSRKLWESTDFNLAGDVHHDVLALEVAVDEALGVEELEGGQDLVRDVRDVFVAETMRLSSLQRRSKTRKDM